MFVTGWPQPVLLGLSDGSLQASPARRVARSIPVHGRNYGWAELMKRVFALDVLACPGCGGQMKVIA